MTYGANIEPKTPLTEQQLQEISQEVWGSDIYGKTASTVLAGYQNAYTVHKKPDGFYVASYMSTFFTPQDRLPLRAEPGVTRTEIARSAGRFIRSRQQIPSGLRIEEPDEFDSRDLPSACFHLRPGDITREHLEPFVKERNWQTHQLHGTLGKAFDVINAAAGFAITPERTAQQDNKESISYTELRSMIKQSVQDGEISNYHFTAIPRNISYLGHNQVHLAQPHTWGELVFSGEVSDGHGYGFSWERVAISSLGALARGGYAKHAKMAPAYLLQHFGAA